MGFQPYGSFRGGEPLRNKFKDLYVDTFYLSREMLLMDKAVIRSHNYESGVAGFILRQDGTVEFNGLTVAEDIQSSNFVTGVSGYFLDYSTGSAEFNDVTIRGTLAAGTITGDLVLDGGAIYTETAAPYIKLSTNGLQVYNATPTLVAGLNYDASFGTILISGGWWMDVLKAPGDGDTFVNIGDTVSHFEVGGLGSLQTGLTWQTERVVATGPVTTFDYDWYLLYDKTNNALQVKLNAGVLLEFGVSTLTASVPLILPTGSAAAPSLTYATDQDTGQFRLGADVLGWSAGGTERFRMSTAGFYHNTTGGPYLKAGASAVGTPGYTFTGDGDTGMHWDSANDGRLVAGGASIAQFTTGKFGPGSDNAITLGDASFRWSHLYAQLIYSLGSYSNTTANAANVYINSLGRLYRSTSASKYKEKVEPVDLSAIDLRPVQYVHKETGTTHYGFIAEELAAQDKRLAVFENGEVESYDDRALAAVLAAKVNQLEERLTNLERRGIL